MRQRAEVGDQLPYQHRVGDVALDEAIARVALDGGQGLAMAGIGEQVEIGDLGRCAGDQVVDEVAADEAGAAGNQHPGR